MHRCIATFLVIKKKKNWHLLVSFITCEDVITTALCCYRRYRYTIFAIQMNEIARLLQNY